MICDAIRRGIYAGFSVVGFVCVIIMVYYFIRVVMCLSDLVADLAIKDGDDDDDSDMDD